MGQIKNIKLYIVTDIKRGVDTITLPQESTTKILTVTTTTTNKNHRRTRQKKHTDRYYNIIRLGRTHIIQVKFRSACFTVLSNSYAPTQPPHFCDQPYNTNNLTVVTLVHCSHEGWYLQMTSMGVCTSGLTR